MKKWLFLILLFPLICVAQTYRYLGVEDGLSVNFQNWRID